MKLAIFGGTGRTRRHLVERALEAGHWIVVLACTPVDRLSAVSTPPC